MILYKELVFTILAIFLLTLIGAYVSPSFTQQESFLELFALLVSLLFIFSVLVIFAVVGSKSFALFLALFVGFVLFAFGIYGVLFVVVTFYAVWGGIFAMEALLLDYDVVSAQKWFEERYTFKSFRHEFTAFYPLLLLTYLLLELCPSFFLREHAIDFSPQRIVKKVEKLL
jgi:membrane-associated HD superfamily phosphohydrolase